MLDEVHEEVDPHEGEIFVIAVDPDFEHQGLGRALTVAGYAYLAGLGLTEGILYVDAANTAAVTLYRSLGLEVVRGRPGLRAHDAEPALSGRHRRQRSLR